MLEIALIFLVVAGISITIQRLVKNKREKLATGRIVTQIEKDPAVAQTIAKNLYYKYATLPVDSAAQLHAFLDHVKQEKEIGKFNIQLVHPMDGYRFLLVTTATDNDIDAGVTGRMGDAKKIYNLNFLLVLDPGKKELVVYSENYYSPADRGLRESFGNIVRRFMNNQ